MSENPLLVDLQEFVAENLLSPSERRTFVEDLRKCVRETVAEDRKGIYDLSFPMFFTFVAPPLTKGGNYVFRVVPSVAAMKKLCIDGIHTSVKLISVPLGQQVEPEIAGEKVGALLDALDAVLDEDAPFDFGDSAATTS